MNTDGDNQYYGGDVARLVEPILQGRAELVIGDREPSKVEHFSSTKKFLQNLGSRVVSTLADLEVSDVASGFKAYSREAASLVCMSTDFDHTVDHVIQAGRKRIPTLIVPIRTNDKLRESRLFSSPAEFVMRSVGIMVRVYASYGAMKIFSAAGLATLSLGVLLGLRFVYFFLFTDHADLHIQSLILAAIMMLAGFQMILTGVVAELISKNRTILEGLSYRLQRLERGGEDPLGRAAPGLVDHKRRVDRVEVLDGAPLVEAAHPGLVEPDVALEHHLGRRRRLDDHLQERLEIEARLRSRRLRHNARRSLNAGRVVHGERGVDQREDRARRRLLEGRGAGDPERLARVPIVITTRH